MKITKKPTDTEILTAIIHMVRNYYQTRFTGYDTWIDRDSVHCHIQSMVKDAFDIDGKIDAISKIANGE